MSVLVLGASGFVGRSLVSALTAAGEHVRAASRRAVEGVSGDVSWMQVDLEEPHTLRPALEGVTCAFYLVHSMGHGSADFRETERRCAQNLVREAPASGCQRIVYLGGVAPKGEPSQHLASRLEVGSILRSGLVPAVELRASMIVGNGSASWRIVRDLAARLPFMVLPRWLESRTCPIALPDVITALVDARMLPPATRGWFDLPGPDTLRAREMLEIVSELMGRRILEVRVPLLTPRLSSLWLKLITSADYDVARELVLGLRDDLLPANEQYWELTGHPPRWSFRSAAAQALATEPETSWPAHVVERLVGRLGAHAP